jgi:hypothetical protein
MRRIIWLGTIAMALAWQVGSAAGSAAQATPVTVQCTTAPLSADSLTTIVEAGYKPAPALKPADEPAPARDLVAVYDLLSESVACTNANQPMRALALYTDRYLAERFSGQAGEDELGHLLAAATRSPKPASPEDQLVLLAVTDLVQYQDGRIGAMVTTANKDESFTDLLIFAKTDDGLRIDQAILQEDLSATPAATPGSQNP